MAAAEWTVYDEGYLQAYQWSGALAGGTPLPQVESPVQLGPGEVAHAQIAPVGLSGFFGEQKDANTGVLLFGGPAGLLLTGAASYAHRQDAKRAAARAAVPTWHGLGQGGITLTNQRVVLELNGQAQSYWYAEAGAFEATTSPQGFPAVQFQPNGAPLLRIDSEWAPMLYVFAHFLVDGAAPGVPMPEGLLERAQAQGRLAQ